MGIIAFIMVIEILSMGVIIDWNFLKKLGLKIKIVWTLVATQDRYACMVVHVYCYHISHAGDGHMCIYNEKHHHW